SLTWDCRLEQVRALAFPSAALTRDALLWLSSCRCVRRASSCKGVRLLLSPVRPLLPYAQARRLSVLLASLESGACVNTSRPVLLVLKHQIPCQMAHRRHGSCQRTAAYGAHTCCKTVCPLQ